MAILLEDAPAEATRVLSDQLTRFAGQRELFAEFFDTAWDDAKGFASSIWLPVRSITRKQIQQDNLVEVPSAWLSFLYWGSELLGMAELEVVSGRCEFLRWVRGLGVESLRRALDVAASVADSDDMRLSVVDVADLELRGFLLVGSRRRFIAAEPTFSSMVAETLVGVADLPQSDE